MQQIRLMGTTADAGITNVTEEQLVEISKSSLVLDVGIQQRLGSVDTEQLRNARLGVVWINDTEWEHHRLPTISGVVGNYPLSKSEIMLPTWVLEQMGISDQQIGMEIVLSYQICLLYTSRLPLRGLPPCSFFTTSDQHDPKPVIKNSDFQDCRTSSIMI